MTGVAPVAEGGQVIPEFRGRRHMNDSLMTLNLAVNLTQPSLYIHEARITLQCEPREGT